METFIVKVKLKTFDNRDVKIYLALVMWSSPAHKQPCGLGRDCKALSAEEASTQQMTGTITSPQLILRDRHQGK